MIGEVSSARTRSLKFVWKDKDLPILYDDPSENGELSRLTTLISCELLIATVSMTYSMAESFVD